MKRYISLCSACLLIWSGIGLLTGCSSETALDPVAPGNSGSEASLSIVAGIPQNIITRAAEVPKDDKRNTNGSWMGNFTVFLFAIDATGSSKPLLAKTTSVSPAATIQANTIELTARELISAGIKAGSHVAVYAIANHQSPLANPENLTKADVMALTSTMPDHKINGYYPLVPMSGSITDYEIKATPSQAVPITMMRTAVRLEITVIDDEFDQDKFDNGKYGWEISTVKLYNDYLHTYFWKVGIPLNASLRPENQAFERDMFTYQDKNYPDVGGIPTEKEYPLGVFYMNSHDVDNPTNPLTIKIPV